MECYMVFKSSLFLVSIFLMFSANAVTEQDKNNLLRELALTKSELQTARRLLPRLATSTSGKNIDSALLHLENAKTVTMSLPITGASFYCLVITENEMYPGRGSTLLEAGFEAFINCRDNSGLNNTCRSITPKCEREN